MKISDKGLEMIKKAEGYMPKIYLDQAGLPTIGYGHLLTKTEKASGLFEGKELSKAEATELLRRDVQEAEESIGQLVKVQLNQNQFDALVDFVFNVGTNALKTSTLLKLLNAGDYASVPAQLMRWNKITNPKTGKKEPLAGLTKRRQREADLWSAE